jgi:hypothetical protein
MPTRREQLAKGWASFKWRERIAATRRVLATVPGEIDAIRLERRSQSLPTQRHCS